MDIISKDMLKECKGHEVNTFVSWAKQHILQGHIKDIQDDDWTIQDRTQIPHISGQNTFWTRTRTNAIYRT